MAVICKNCGFSNADGDEFCGNCGRYLEFTGVAAEDTQAAPPPPPDGAGGDTGEAAAAGLGAAAGGQDSGPPPPPDDTTISSPPPPPPGGGGAAPPPPPPPGGGGAQAQPQPTGRGPDVICWNCGRRNPGGRTFCIQCGERLAAGKPTTAVKTAAVGAAAAGGAGAGKAGGPGGPPPPSGGGPNLKVIGIGAGIIVALLAVAVVLGGFLGGGNNPSPTPTSVSVASPTATSGTSPTASLGSASPGVSATLPTDTATASLPTPTDTGTPPTDGPTAKPTRTPKVTPNGTPDSSNTCAGVGNRGKFTTGFVPGSSRVIPDHTAWCVKSVTFKRGNGSGTLKIYLVNNAFDVSPYGWAEAQQPESFGGSSTYQWDFSIDLPQGYDNIPPGTTVQMQTTNHATGTIFITYVAVKVP